MSLLKDKEELIANFDVEIIYNILSKYYIDPIHEEVMDVLGIDINNIESTPDGVIYHGPLSLCVSLEESKNIKSLEFPGLNLLQVDGNFDCMIPYLKTLKGAPKKVGGRFTLFGCTDLTSLEYAPKEVSGGFICSNCHSLKNLEGAPKKVGGSFDCSDCKSLESLEGAPEEVGGDFDCSKCPHLKSLKGGPRVVKKYFDCSYCSNLETLEGAPKEVGEGFICTSCNSLQSLKGLPENIKDFDYRWCKNLIIR